MTSLSIGLWYGNQLINDMPIIRISSEPKQLDNIVVIILVKSEVKH